MGKRFESQCTYDLAVCREYQRSLAGILPVEKVLQYAAILCLAAGVIFRLTGGANGTADYAVMVLLMYFLMKDATSGGKREYKRMAATNNGEPIQTAVTVEEDIHAQDLDHGTSLHFAFEQVKLIGETKNLLIIMMENNQGVLVDKRSLSGGSAEELMAVLFERCTKLKRKQVLKGTDARIRKAAIIILIILYVIL